MSSSASFTQAIRDAAAFVAARAQFVTINEDRIAPYAAELLAGGLQPQTDLDKDTLGADMPAEQKAAYVLALDALNFGSGYFETARMARVTFEYAELAQCLLRAFADHRWDKPIKWRTATPTDCHDVFAIPMGKHPHLDGLMRLFAGHLRDAGGHICTEYQGSALALVQAADGSAARLAELVSVWQGFRDVATYAGRIIPIYKRAQILAADMHLAFQGEPPADFDDMASLTIFADNMVPHVLRHDGVLSYAPKLAETVDSGILIDSGDVCEVELRAVSIHAVELLRAAAMAQGFDVTSVNLDHLLWNRGYSADLLAKPRHRTLSVWY